MASKMKRMDSSLKTGDLTERTMDSFFKVIEEKEGRVKVYSKTLRDRGSSRWRSWGRV